MTTYVITVPDEVQIDLDSLPASLTYDGNNNLLTQTVTYLDKTYKQTFTYTGTNLVSYTAWELQ